MLMLSHLGLALKTTHLPAACLPAHPPAACLPAIYCTLAASPPANAASAQTPPHGHAVTAYLPLPATAISVQPPSVWPCCARGRRSCRPPLFVCLGRALRSCLLWPPRRASGGQATAGGS